MPDRAEEIAKKLRSALREEAKEKNTLNSATSLGIQKYHATKYVAAHLKVKVLREALIKELGLPMPSLEEVLNGSQEKA